MPTHRPSDHTLIRRAQTGDADAIAELYQLNASTVYRYFFFRVHDQAAAEDLTAEVFLKMVEALPRYVDRGVPFVAWLLRMAHDRFVDHCRRAAHRQTEVLSETLVDGLGDAETLAFQISDNNELHRWLAELTPDQQLVVQLRFIEGYNLDETAAILNNTTGAIKALQHRALRQLARWIKR